MSKKPKKSRKHVRCIVRNCQNHTDEGKFVGPMCAPCYHFIVDGIDMAATSQAFRNAVELVWPRIKRHLGRQLKTFFFDFEEKPHQLADYLIEGSLADRALADLIRGCPTVENKPSDVIRTIAVKYKTDEILSKAHR